MVYRWGYVHAVGRLGQLACTEVIIGQDLFKIRYIICIDNRWSMIYGIPSSLTLRGK
jgi:hypothetical protein